jgi:Domain of unknown function (DUF6431)
LRDSIIGHGWRRKQAHDESHDWIKVRRGICKLCRLTFTFLPRFSLPHTHYSSIARSQALRRYFLEHRSWETAAPAVKDPDRIPDSSNAPVARYIMTRLGRSFKYGSMNFGHSWEISRESLA